MIYALCLNNVVPIPGDNAHTTIRAIRLSATVIAFVSSVAPITVDGVLSRVLSIFPAIRSNQILRIVVPF